MVESYAFFLQGPLFLSVYLFVSFITVIILLQMKKNKKSEVVKKLHPASSNKNSQTKIAPLFFVWLDLPQIQAFEHCLKEEIVKSAL
ncbi:hypothetical protein I8F73_03610 [Enterococcus faecalis]|nr:hypothetical protein [Enterococcus faecalis]